MNNAPTNRVNEATLALAAVYRQEAEEHYRRAGFLSAQAERLERIARSDYAPSVTVVPNSTGL